MRRPPESGVQLWPANGRARRVAAEPAFESIITSTRSSKRNSSTTCEEVEVDFNGSRQARTVASLNSRQTSSGIPANSARQRTAPPAAAAKQGSASNCSLMCLGSVATGVREGNITSFPAVRAIVKAVHAETDVFHALADRAIFVAS